MTKRQQLAHFCGGGIAMFMLLFLTKNQGFSLAAPSFGASAMLIFALGNCQPAASRKAFWGQVLSALVGVGTGKLLGTTWYSVAIAVFLALMVMLVSDTFHPPGGATAFLAADTGQDWQFVIFPIAAGMALMLLVRFLCCRLLAFGQTAEEKVREKEAIP